MNEAIKRLLACFASVLVTGAATCVVAFESGCAPVVPKVDTVAGQVFIVTRGGENVKLGLVRVELLSESAAIRHVEIIPAQIAARAESLRPDLEAAIAAMDLARRRAVEAKVALRKAQGQYDWRS